MNKIKIDKMDKTNVNSRLLIDSITASYRIKNYTEGCQMVKNNEIVCTNHREYIINTNLEEYFNDSISTWNEINKVIINLSRRS